MENTVGGSHEGGAFYRDNAAQNVIYGKRPEYSCPPPPFLMKVFNLVEDPETNSFISWKSNGTSFVIWDHNYFAAQVLPRHFKTDNFSSFVYQLNNYGFKKISSNHYEYANPWFQSGKKDWLKNIKRRNKLHQVSKKTTMPTPAATQDSANPKIETELDAIMGEQINMKEQIQNLKQKQDDMMIQLADLEAKNSVLEFKHDKMIPAILLKQFAQFVKEKKGQATGHHAKKPKLSNPKITQEFISSADDSGSCTQDQKVKTAIEEKPADFAFWNSIWNDDNYNAWFKKNGGQGDLAADHAKAFVKLDEMKMKSDIVTQSEKLNVQRSVSDVEDDHHLELWT